MEKAKEIQEKLKTLQQEMHAKVEACDVRYNKEKNGVFAKRAATIAELIAKKEAPANFWALALINLLHAKDRESTTMPHFLGPYDESLLQSYLTEIAVLYTEKGHRITLRFKPNPFFEESELWAEAVEVLPAEEDEEEDEEEDAPPVSESWAFSGVTWKEGHGPTLDEGDEEDDEEEDDDEEDGEGGASAAGKKRQHAPASSGAMHGPSVLEVFSEMPPHPDEDDEVDYENDDELMDAVEEWEAEMDDRKMLLRLIELYIHHNPVEAIQAAAGEESAAEGEAAVKKAKTE